MLTEVHNTDNNVKTAVNKQGSGHAAAAVESAFIPWITPPVVLPHLGTPFLSPQGATTGGATSLLAGVGAERGAYPSFLRSTIAAGPCQKVRNYREAPRWKHIEGHRRILPSTSAMADPAN